MAVQPDLAKPGVVIVDGTTGAAVVTGGTAATAQFEKIVVGSTATSATNPQPVQLSQANAAVTAANPVPAQLSQAGAALTAANPVPTQLSIAGIAVSAAAPLPVLPNGGYNAAAAHGPTNPMIATDVIFGDTVSKGGGAAAPGAGSAFVSYAGNALAAGRHRITVLYSISGASETASNGANVRLSDASGGFTAIDLPSNNGGTSGVAYGPFTFEVTVASTNTVKLTAIAAATASTVYAGTMVAKRIS